MVPSDCNCVEQALIELMSSRSVYSDQTWIEDFVREGSHATKRGTLVAYYSNSGNSSASAPIAQTLLLMGLKDIIANVCMRLVRTCEYIWNMKRALWSGLRGSNLRRPP